MGMGMGMGMGAPNTSGKKDLLIGRLNGRD